MASPSVVVRVLGDLKGLGTSFDQAGTKAQSSANRARGAFSGFLSSMNQTGVLGPFAGSLGMVDAALQSMTGHARTLGTTMMGVGGGMTAVGATLTALGSKEQAAHNQLQAAISATGHSYEEYGSQIEAAVKHNENFAQSSASTQSALQVLTQATHDPNEALKLLNVTTDLAAAKHIDLTTAATAIGRTYNGNARLLKQYGIEVDKHTHLTKDNQTAIEALSGVLSGQASASVNTFSGHLKVLQTHVEDSIAQFGTRWGPAIQTMGIAVLALGTIWEITGPLIAAMEGLAFWPILLIIGGLVALGVAAYELYTHWSTVWGFIKGIVVDVWNWIRVNWPLLLAILTGPIGIAAYLIISNFNTIKSVGATIFDGVRAAAESVFRFVARLWNDTLGQLNFSIPSWIPGIGGHSFGFPTIRSFAEGGYVPTTGLALLHAGETVTPAGAGGPAIAVEHLHIGSGLDLETLMARAAWVQKTRT
jgi:hypothetical protein